MTSPIYVPAEGSKSADYIIIGEAPGENEENQRRPFIGQSGLILRIALSRVGIAESNTYITNVCHYRPPYNKIDKFAPKRTKKGIKNRAPNELVREGMYELYRDIAEIHNNGGAKILIPLGNVALWALTGMESVLRRR